MEPTHIRNFSIIAHIDHGKSTLADRMLEHTGTIEKRRMMDQVLDSMDLERERGITIKMQPVRMHYSPQNEDASQSEYILNLIDTPGHIDFSYEVSRALKAVEGSILLVDATQGVQAQTITTLEMAEKLGLTIIPVISKIDSPLARIDEVKLEVAALINCDPNDVLEVSGKTGQGVEELLQAVVKRVPAPRVPEETNFFRSLVFDFEYSTHRGVVVFVRVMSGSLKKTDKLIFKVAGKDFGANEIGIFAPDERPVETLSVGEIGYIVTGIKEAGIASVGDTVASVQDILPPLSGYEKPSPVVWASLYPENQGDITLLRQSLDRLRLSDSSLSYEEETSGVLGRGFRCGFLGMLHLEIVTERLRRESNLELIVTTPSITYDVVLKNGKKERVYSPALFPDYGDIVSVEEPWVRMRLMTPHEYLGDIMQVLFDHEATVGSTETFGGERVTLYADMPLREMMRNFFDILKSVSSGFASISYEITDMRKADVVRMDLLVADEIVPAFSRVIGRRLVEAEAEKAVEKMHAVLPRQMFTTKIQSQALGRIISSRTLSAMKKDVTQHMYGGDITRKMKLRDKQKKGKKKMLQRGRVTIPHEVFMKMMKGE
jgi:GTP-binding protein LepA